MPLPPTTAGLLADALLALHAALALFITGLPPAVWMGARRGWPLARSRALRLGHLAAMAFVALEGWLGMVCPLTEWEYRLRQAAGLAGRYGQRSFMDQWVGQWLYHDLPDWSFALAYTAWLAATLLTWRLVPPRPRQPRWRTKEQR